MVGYIGQRRHFFDALGTLYVVFFFDLNGAKAILQGINLLIIGFGLFHLNFILVTRDCIYLFYCHYCFVIGGRHSCFCLRR